MAIALLVAGLFAAATAFPQSAELQSRDELNQGVQAYKAGQYAEAVRHFEKAVALDPSNQNAQLYLATGYYIQWIPGADGPDNQQNYNLAKREFNEVLEKDPKNALALAMMASMAYNSAQVGTPEQKATALDEAKKWNERRLEVNPQDSEAFYYLGVIAWARSFPPIQKARVAAHMAPSDAGPLKDAAVKSQLQAQYWSAITDGVEALKHCLEIDKENEDAMSYMNLLLRKKADLEDSPGAAEQDISQAEGWVKRALDSKKAKASRPQGDPPN